MASKGDVDYYLRIGQLELDFDNLPMGRFSVVDERGCLHTVPKLGLTLKMTTDTRRIHAGDRVEFFIRARGETGWGRSVFTGHVLNREPGREKVKRRPGERKRTRYEMEDVIRIHARGTLDQLHGSEEDPQRYDGTMTEMLYQWTDRFFDGLADEIDIDVTEPEIFPKKIRIPLGTPWSLLSEIRRYAAIDVSYYATGEPGLGRRSHRVLRVRDEMTPDMWADLTDETRSMLTLEDVPLVEPSEELIAVSPNIRAPSWMSAKIGAQYCAAVNRSLIQLRHNGRVILTGIDPSHTNPLRDPNGLILVKCPEKGLTAPLAVQAVKIYRDGVGLSIRLTYTSRVLPYYVPSLMPGGCNARASPLGQRSYGIVGQLRDGTIDRPDVVYN